MGRLNYDQAPALGVPTVDPTNVSNQAASTEFVQNAIPPGVVHPYAGPIPPAGWLLCDGSAVSRTTYARLFAAIGTIHGAGDGSTTFNLPDLRGEFLRGLDNGRGVDAGRALGTTQAAQIKAGISPSQVVNAAGGGDNFPYSFSAGTMNGTYSLAKMFPDAALNGETRPRNIAMNFIIKAQ